MRPHHSLIPFALLATPALADVTAEDVWQNMGAEARALGVTIAAAPQRQGAALSVGPVIWSYALPMEFGRIELRSEGPVLTELADGRVRIDMAPASTVTGSILGGFEGDTGEVRFAFDMALTDSAGMASGTPGQISYQTSAVLTEATLSSLTLLENGTVMPQVDAGNVAIYLRLSDMQRNATITAEGATVSAEQTASVGEVIYDFSTEIAGEGALHYVGQINDIASVAARHLPGTPPDLINLAPALRAGLSISTQSTIGASVMQSRSDFEFEGGSFNQMQQSQQQVAGFSLDASGLQVSSSAVQAKYDMTLPEVPVPIRAEIAQVLIDVGMPLLAGPEAQPAHYNFRFADVKMDESLWQLFDPGQSLPRGPITIGVDLLAQLKITTDLVDFAALGEVFDAGQSPADLVAVAFDNLDLAALGARLTGAGAFNVDLADAMAFGGEPRFEGHAGFDLVGSEAVLNALTASGLVPQEALMGTRMGMGLVFEQQPDGSLHSDIEMSFDGSISANGQRLQ